MRNDHLLITVEDRVRRVQAMLRSLGAAAANPESCDNVGFAIEDLARIADEELEALIDSVGLIHAPTKAGSREVPTRKRVGAR